MHLKVFLKLKNPYKLSLLGKYIKKKNKKKQKKPLGWIKKKKHRVSSNPAQAGLQAGRVHRQPFRGVRGLRQVLHPRHGVLHPPLAAQDPPGRRSLSLVPSQCSRSVTF
jgi:hypothetical protein